MIKVLDMKFIRYVNLFSKVTRLSCNHCFEYNNTIIFAVPRELVSRAIGPNNMNLQRLSNIIGKRVKIIAIPNGIEDIENFVSVVTMPIRVKAIEIRDGEAIVTVNAQSKASFIGKAKIRLEEMQNILEQYFGIKKIRVK